MAQRRTGTKEWSNHSKNIQIGCENNCIYCYARYDAIERYGYVKSPDDWENNVRPNSKVNERPKKLDGRIMFPTTHDITKNNVRAVTDYLKKWLAVGNEFLIVSKPDPDCIEHLCRRLHKWKDQIVFRFTIGSTDNDVLKFWEKNAPTFEQRLEALKYAYHYGYDTSVSAEPFLDDTIQEVVRQVQPFVTDTIWIGKMNRADKRVDKTGWGQREYQYLMEVWDAQRDWNIWGLFGTLKNNQQIRWKDSIKDVIGLLPEGVG